MISRIDHKHENYKQNANFFSKSLNLEFNCVFINLNRLIFQVVLAFVSFFVISVGGTIIGVIWGIATSFVTRFTEHVRGASSSFHRPYLSMNN